MSHERPLVDAQNPWPGLDKYREEEAAYFFGREEEVNELARLLAVENLLVLYGRSGVGKSSLLSAGLFPELRPRHLLPVCVRLEFSPALTARDLSSQVLDRLIEEMQEHQIEHPRPATDESLWAYLHRRDRELWSRDNHLVTPVLVFDQFEECFTLGEQAPERVEELRHLLADLLEGRIPEAIAAKEHTENLDLHQHDYKVLLSLREDLLPDLETWRDQVPSLLRTRLRLQPLSIEAAEKAVAGAGSQVVEAEAVPKIVRFVANQEDDAERLAQAAHVEPVLLSLFCTQLNRRRGGRKIDSKLVDRRKENILRDYYRHALGGMSESVAQSIEDKLVVGDRFRVRYPREQLLTDGDVTAEQLEELTTRRLLRVDPHQGEYRVELIHDRLVSVVVEERDRRARREAEEESRREAAAARQEAERARATQERDRWIAGAMVLLALITLLAAWAAWIASKRAEETLTEAGRRAFGRAQEALAEQDYDRHCAYLAESLSYSDRPLVRSASALALQQASSFPLRFLLRHEGAVNDASFSPDGSLVVTASADDTAKVWDAASGEQVGETLQHEDVVNSASFSPDGTLVVTASRDGTARVWDAASGAALAKLRPQDAVTSASFSPNGALIVTTSVGGTAQLWQTASGAAVGEPLRHDAAVYSATFSPDGAQLVTVGLDAARLWDTVGGAAVGEPLSHTGPADSASFSPDGSRVVTISETGVAGFWDAATGAELRKFWFNNESVVSASFSPDGTLFTTTEKGSIQVRDASNGSFSGEPLRLGVRTVSASFSPDGIRIVTLGEDSAVRIWDAANRALVGQPLRHSCQVNSVSFSPDSALVVTAGEDGTARVWDVAKGAAEGETLRFEHHVFSAGFHTDGVRVITSGEREPFRVRDASGAALGEPLRFEGRAVSAALGPDGIWLVAAGADGMVRVFDATSGAVLGQPLAQEGFVNSASFTSTDTQSRVVISGWDVRVWDPETGALVGEPLTPEGHWVSVSLSPDGTQVLAASEAVVGIWDAESGAALAQPIHSEPAVATGSWSPDGARILTANSNGTVQLWDAMSGAALGLPMHHKGPVDHASFSPDGTRIVTAGRGRTAHVWDTRSSLGADDSLLVSALQAISGSRIADAGQLGALSPEEVLGERRRLLRLSRRESDFSRLIHWHLADRGTRTISPFSAVTVAEYIEREIDWALLHADSAPVGILRDAYALDPGHPLILLALSIFEDRPEAKKLWKELSMPRIQGDARIAARAAEILQQDNDPDYAARAARIALDLEPDNEAAQAVLDWATEEQSEPVN